ncbi:AP5Z1 [Symbiodinium natans]|uniref:AP5Z1 protein n=1 Tax=Symbiodinium natans TaxID=878477 RepID=A0A812JTN9_9DINO|nr:AP5Z1 [Symbiodinium natans]
MERIGQSDVATILGRLHQELKSQTRDSKAEQHQLMRKAFHYVTASLHQPTPGMVGGAGNTQARKLSEVTHRVLQELFALLVGDSGFAPPRIRILSSALVRELSSGEVPYFFRDNFGGNFDHYDQNKVVYFLPVLSQLLNADLLVKNIPNLVMWFTSDSTSMSLKTAALTNLLAAVQRFPNVLDQDQHIRPMESQFCKLLTGASLETRKTTSTTLFGVRIVSSSASCNVTEVDGTPTRDFFTCMNNSYDYSDDQLLNVHIFSSLYCWLFYLYQAQLLEIRKRQSRDDIVSKLEHYGLVHGEAPKEVPLNELKKSDKSSLIGHFTLDEEFREVVISICLRILSQVELDIVRDGPQQMRLGARYVISELDWMREFIEGVSMEAVRILDLLCLMDPSLVTRIFPAVKKVYERTANRQSGVVFAAVLQFFVNHGQHVIFDVDPVLHHFFEDYVSVRYRQQLLAMSTLLFLTTNTSKMLLHTPVFPKYYPAIIKLLVWHPRTLAEEVLPIVPAMVGPSSFAELFHTLLDLPLTAAFMEQYERPDEHSDGQMTRLGLDRTPPFKTVHQYIMRNQAGGACIWEARDEAQLSMIRVLWNSLPVTPRVSSVCKLVPRFLRVYFDVLLSNAPPECIERVVPLLLQRFASLYPVDFFLNSVHTLIIDTLQAIFQQWPAFLMSLKREVVHAISTHLDVQGRLLVLHLCWIIGELLRPPLYENGGRGGVAMFFEALETLAYQAISVRVPEPEEAAKEPKVSESREPEKGPGPTGSQEDEGAEEGDHSPEVVKVEFAVEEIFSPRFVAVITASLTKLGTKFPEFAPRVVLCLLKMQQHYATDFSDGVEFVRDRLADSLQLLRHSAISSSVYSSSTFLGFETDRALSSVSALSSLGHLSHDPSTSGAALHDFELPYQPPIAAAADDRLLAWTPLGAPKSQDVRRA